MSARSSGIVIAETIHPPSVINLLRPESSGHADARWQLVLRTGEDSGRRTIRGSQPLGNLSRLRVSRRQERSRARGARSTTSPMKEQAAKQAQPLTGSAFFFSQPRRLCPRPSTGSRSNGRQYQRRRSLERLHPRHSHPYRPSHPYRRPHSPRADRRPHSPRADRRPHSQKRTAARTAQERIRHLVLAQSLYNQGSDDEAVVEARKAAKSGEKDALFHYSGWRHAELKTSRVQTKLFATWNPI